MASYLAVVARVAGQAVADAHAVLDGGGAARTPAVGARAAGGAEGGGGGDAVGAMGVRGGAWGAGGGTDRDV